MADLIGWWKWNEWCPVIVVYSLAVPLVSLNGLIGYLVESREFLCISIIYIYGFQMSNLIDLF